MSEFIHVFSENGTPLILEDNKKFIIISKKDNMNKILRQGLDCQGNFTGSKMGKCNLKANGVFKGIGLVQAGTDLTGIEKKEFHDKLVKEGKLFPYMGLYNYTDNTPEDVINTSPSGLMTLGRESQPQFTFEYDKGECNNKSLRNKLTGDWDLIIYTNVGIIVTEDKAQTKVQGFKLAFNHAKHSITNAEATEIERTSLTVQLAYAEQWNDRKEILLYENTDYSLAEIDGAEGVNVEADVKAGTEVVITVSNICNTNSKIIGLQDKANFKVNGVEPTNVAQNLSKQGQYTLTLTDALIVAEDFLIEVNAEDEAGFMYVGYLKGIVKSS